MSNSCNFFHHVIGVLSKGAEPADGSRNSSHDAYREGKRRVVSRGSGGDYSTDDAEHNRPHSFVSHSPTFPRIGLLLGALQCLVNGWYQKLWPTWSDGM
jgi:hypothetical protein